MQDRIDKILGQWKRERPDLDTRPMGVIGRIQRATAALRPLLDEPHEEPSLHRKALRSRRRGEPRAHRTTLGDGEATPRAPVAPPRRDDELHIRPARSGWPGPRDAPIRTIVAVRKCA